MSTHKQRSGKNIETLKEIEEVIGQGVNPPVASRQAGISLRTFYRWRKEHGRMRVDQAKRLVDLENESIRLKLLMAEKGFDTQKHIDSC